MTGNHYTTGHCIFNPSLPNVNKIIEDACYDGLEINISIEICFECIRKYIELNEKKVLNAIDNKNTSAMFFIGYYYENIKFDSNKYKYYYIMAADNGNFKSMMRVGQCQGMTIDADMRKKYTLMAMNKILSENNTKHNSANDPLQYLINCSLSIEDIYDLISHKKQFIKYCKERGHDVQQLELIETPLYSFESTMEHIDIGAINV